MWSRSGSTGTARSTSSSAVPRRARIRRFGGRSAVVRKTIQVMAVRPDRDALEIRFLRVEGYRVELPEERLSAKFTN